MQTRSSPDLNTLRKLAAQEAIPNYLTMSKKDLFSILRERGSFGRVTRHHTQKVGVGRKILDPLAGDVSKKRSKKMGRDESAPEIVASVPVGDSLNEYDPIMLTPIGNEPCFNFTRPNGTKLRFCIESLVDYMLASGEFSDPETRIPFSDENLSEIDTIAKNSGLQKASVLESKKNCQKYSDSKFRRDALLAIERCAGEVVTHMLEVIETEEPEDAQEELLTEDFPQYADYFRQMREADKSYASKCSAHWRLYLQGPPNRPNRDRAGLLRAAILFLKNCDSGLYS